MSGAVAVATYADTLSPILSPTLDLRLHKLNLLLQQFVCLRRLLQLLLLVPSRLLQAVVLLHTLRQIVLILLELQFLFLAI